MAAAAAGRGADAVLATNSYLLASAARSHAVATVHDLVAFDPELRLPRGSAAERLTLPLAIRRRQTLLCVSEATRSALVERYPRAAPLAHVVPHGVESRFFVDRPEQPYVLMTGTLEPRKNVVRAIEAAARLPDALRERFELGWRARAAGTPTRSRRRWRATATRSGSSASCPTMSCRTSTPGRPSSCTRRSARASACPCWRRWRPGRPVVTSNLSSLPEVGGDAVRYVDPYDVDSIRAGLEELLGDGERRAQLAAAGRERAREFSWDRTARETLALLSER